MSISEEQRRQHTAKLGKWEPLEHLDVVGGWEVSLFSLQKLRLLLSQRLAEP